jgi:hypothetical protein
MGNICRRIAENQTVMMPMAISQWINTPSSIGNDHRRLARDRCQNRPIGGD